MKLKSPLSVQWELTNNCNHQCIYCYKNTKQDNSFDESLTDKVINDLVDNNIFSLTLTGGEPFLKKEKLIYITNKLKNSNINISVNTNLTYIDEQTIDALIDNGANCFLISCPSHKKELYEKITNSSNYELFLTNLKLIQSKPVSNTINMVVNKLNKDLVYQTGEFLINKFGIKQFCASPINPTNQFNFQLALTNEEINKTFEDLIKLKEDYSIKIGNLTMVRYCSLSETVMSYDELISSCSAGSTSMVISHDFKIRPCPELTYEVGSLHDESFNDLWLKLQLWREGINIKHNCVGCDKIKSCAGGCISYEQYINKPELKKPLIKRSQNQLIFDLKKNYSISHVRYRLENGDYLITQGKQFIIGNESLVIFIKELEKLGEFNPLKFINEHQLGDEGLALLTYLYFNKFLIEK